MVTGNWNIQFITDWDEIYSKSFQDQWLHYLENAVNSHVFFHPALGMAWLKTYRALRNLAPLFCIALKDDSRIFLPLVFWKQNWKDAFRRVVVPVGYSDFDYHDPLDNRQISGNEWASFYESLADAIKLKVNYDAIEINGIRTEVTSKNWHKESDIAPFYDLTQFTDSENFLQSLKTSLRGDIRRQIRRISELGPLILHHYNTVDEALNILPQFLKLHSDRWPGAYKAPGFHKNLIVYGLKSGIMHFTSLKSGDRTLSYHLGFTYSKTCYYYMPVIDPEYENLSPGKVHLFKLVERAIAERNKIFDHLRGDENYKEGWTNRVQSLYKFSYQNISLTSKVRNEVHSIKEKIV